MKRWIFTALCCLLIYPSSAFAQTTITVDAKDKPLQITGWLNEENTLVGSIRLSASEVVNQLTFLASDLKRQEGEGGINRQQIAFIGEPKLQAGIPKDFQVKVTNPQLPGTYKGQIEVFLANQKPQVIPFTVLVKVRPTLIPLQGNEQVQLQLTQCNPLLDCGLARLLFPASAFLQSWDLAFDNSVDAPVKVTGAEVLLKGEQTGYHTKSGFDTPVMIALDRAATIEHHKCVDDKRRIREQAFPKNSWIGVRRTAGAGDRHCGEGDRHCRSGRSTLPERAIGTAEAGDRHGRSGRSARPEQAIGTTMGNAIRSRAVKIDRVNK